MLRVRIISLQSLIAQHSLPRRNCAVVSVICTSPLALPRAVLQRSDRECVQGHPVIVGRELRSTRMYGLQNVSSNPSPIDAWCQYARIYSCILMRKTAGHNAKSLPRSHYFSGPLWPLRLSDFRGWSGPIASSVVRRSQTVGGCTAEYYWFMCSCD